MSQDKTGPLKEAFMGTKLLSLCSMTYCCYDVNSIKFKIGSKSLNKRVQEQNYDGHLDFYQRLLDKNVHFMSTNRDFRSGNLTVAT